MSERYIRKLWRSGASLLLTVSDILPAGWQEVVIVKEEVCNEQGITEAIKLEIRPVR